MVADSLGPVVGVERIRSHRIPVIDLSLRRDRVSELIVKACEDYGFFKVINHGVQKSVVARMETETMEFFSLPLWEKQMAGPPNPLGYGINNIGSNGDTGELEYLLLHAQPASASHRARAICRKDPTKFSMVANEYVEAVRDLACEILDMIGEGLGLEDSMAFSRLIRDSESDSLLRLNHYPPYLSSAGEDICRNSGKDGDAGGCGRVGFGEHTDPQLLTVLRSNDVPGLQVLDEASPEGKVWVSVRPDPAAFFVNVGDALQAMTNGRLVSVRHRAMANSSAAARLSMMFFGAPPLHARIAPPQEMVAPPGSPRRYKSFTWGEFKKDMYTLRLSNNRLDFFRAEEEKR